MVGSIEACNRPGNVMLVVEHEGMTRPLARLGRPLVYVLVCAGPSLTAFRLE